VSASWCDKLASVPGAGFGIDAHFASSDAILDAVSSITDELFDDPKVLFSLTHQTTFDVRFSTEQGFNYSVEPSKIAVEFKHRMRPRAISGGPPVMEMLSRPLPYTELLPEVVKKLIHLGTLIPKSRERNVTRIGIISTTAVAEEEAPPGISRFIEYMGRPWGGSLETYQMQVNAEISKGQGPYDRCHHTIIKTEDKDALLTVTLDFQRVFSSGIPIRADELKDASDRVQTAALKYFEDVGEGRRFDEEIISSSEPARA
jgi:hypothetical protein